MTAATFGETVRLSFMKNGAADPSRSTVDLRAVLHTGGNDSNSPGAGEQYRTRLAAGEAELFIDRATYTGPTIRAGDKVRGNERAGQPWWAVATVSDRYSNLIVLSLSQS